MIISKTVHIFAIDLSWTPFMVIRIGKDLANRNNLGSELSCQFSLTWYLAQLAFVFLLIVWRRNEWFGVVGIAWGMPSRNKWIDFHFFTVALATVIIIISYISYLHFVKRKKLNVVWTHVYQNFSNQVLISSLVYWLYLHPPLSVSARYDIASPTRPHA